VVRDTLRDAVGRDRMGTDEEFAEYVNETLGMRLMASMARERSNDDEVSGIFYLCFAVIG